MKFYLTSVLHLTRPWLRALGGVILACLFCSCARDQHHLIIVTSTVLGVEIAENPASQLYHIKLGYSRGELALVPTNRRGSTNVADNTVLGGARDAVDVLMELKYASPFSLSEGGIYQRLAVGSNAVSQAGAAFMFAKDTKGAMAPVTAVAVAQAVTGIKGEVVRSAVATTQKLPLATAYSKVPDKAGFNAVAMQNGYLNFAEFLVEANTPLDKLVKVTQDLRTAGLIP
jgi:hypothetical protein